MEELILENSLQPVKGGISDSFSLTTGHRNEPEVLGFANAV